MSAQLPLPETDWSAEPHAEYWRSIGCTMPGNPADPYPWCGRPVHLAYPVGVYPLPIELGPDSRPEPGAVLVCRDHAAAIAGAR